MGLHPDESGIQRDVVLAHVQMPRWMLITAAIAAEITIALVLKEVRFLGYAHAVAIAAVGLYGVLRRDLTVVICTIVYLAGTEVMWRQTRVSIFYLLSPYLVIALSGLAVLLVIGHLGKDARLATLYAALLVPASVATVRTAGQNARELIAFALSGPIALAAFVAFTSQVRITRLLYRRVLWIILVSSIGPLTVAATDVRADLAAQGSISFSKQSNFATSGGFGPVQVSAALSIGMVAAVLLIIIERDRIPRLIAGAATVALGIQTLLTFSRGGSFSFAIAVAVLAVTQARNPRIRNRIIVVAVTMLALSYFLVFPWLEGFTGGMFEKRFSDTQTARTELAVNDTQIFTRNFAFGVGPGMTKYQRLTYEVCEIRTDRCRDEASSHTEFTRTLSEHGIPGLIAICLLLTLAWHGFSRAGPGRQFAVAWMAWAIAQMFYANLRIVAVPIAFGLAFLRFSDQRTLSGSRSTDAGDDHAAFAWEQGRSSWRPDRSLQTMGHPGKRLTSTSVTPDHAGSAPAPPTNHQQPPPFDYEAAFGPSLDGLCDGASGLRPSGQPPSA